MGKMSKRKGGGFERDFCRALSEWWTGGERDDVFYKTGGSGSRAKVRGRAGRQTFGQHGDIAATDPVGNPLTDVFTFELKRGYNKYTLTDLIDRPVRKMVVQQEVEKWLAEVIESHEQAGSLTWMIVHRRDARETVLYMPRHVVEVFENPKSRFCPSAVFSVRLRLGQGHTSKAKYWIQAVTMREFFASVTPDEIRKLSEES